MTYPAAEVASLKTTICERIANGESLRAICAADDMPSASTVCKWLAEDQTFSEQYARARESQADALFDEILTIADDGSNDWMKRKFGDDERWVENGEAMRRSQLRIDARKWMAGKLKPKKYGDRLNVDHSGAIETMSEEQVNARISQLLGKAGIGVPDAAGAVVPSTEEVGRV